MNGTPEHTERGNGGAAERLRQALIAKLIEERTIRSGPVARAFQKVERHRFVPDVDVEHAYADRSIPRLSRDGQLVSSASQPTMMAIMLEQLQVEPGQRVLEIGAGTGYNAALLAELVGPEGHITAIEIEQDLARRARNTLAQTGYRNVALVCRDGGFGYPANAPYDRLILTVGAGDITPAWWEQLADGGRLVMPLALAGLQFSIGFDKQGSRLISRSVHGCGFVLLQGSFAEPLTHRVELAEGIGLTFVSPRDIVPEQVQQHLQRPGPAKELALPAPDAWRDLLFWLQLHEPRLARLVVELDAPEASQFRHFYGFGPPQNVRVSNLIMGEGGLAALTGPPTQEAPIFDADFRPDSMAVYPLFVQQFGDGEEPARRLHELIQAWHEAERPSPDRLRVEALPADQTMEPPPDVIVMRKPHTHFWLSWQ